jgi:hypothetical protein
MSIEAQKQIRENTMELHEFLKDLTDWEQTVKIKEKKLASGATKDSVCTFLYQSLFNKYSIGLYLG